MKKLKVVSLIMILAAIVFGGFSSNVQAATSLPDSVVTEYLDGYSHGLREVEYIKNFPVIVKKAKDGKYVYCMNLSATYAGNIQFNKADKVDDGYIYILLHKPNTGDKDKDFYITQMAVWYYEDYLSGTDFNLVREVKEYIVSNIETDEVARYIYNLYRGAKIYDQGYGVLELGKSAATFTVEDGYYVSSTIKVTTNSKVGTIKYSLTDAPTGSKIVKSGENGIKVKVPVSAIPEGKQLKFAVNVESSYNRLDAYYYFNSSKYQKLLYEDYLETPVKLTDVKEMGIKHYSDYEVNISKTDVTQSKEVPGATLLVKDSTGKEIASWVSTSETHKIRLNAGEYTLTETIAPDGYKLSKTTIGFKVDEAGTVFVKNANGEYTSVDKVVMINELIDVVSIAKKDAKTGNYVSGAVLVVKDDKGNVIKEFTSNDTVYQLSLKEGNYTLSEISAPNGYLLSSEVIEFKLLEDGTLKIKNKNGEYVDAALVTFLNTKADESDYNVPATASSATLLIIGGIALLIGGIACAKKTIKGC